MAQSGLSQALGHDADDDLVGDQLARVHIGLGLQPDGRAVLDGGAEDVAGGDGGDAQLGTEDLSLGAFAGAGGAQQDQLHTHDQSPLLQEALVVPHQHLGLHLLDGLQGDAHHDDDGGAADGQGAVTHTRLPVMMGAMATTDRYRAPNMVILLSTLE